MDGRSGGRSPNVARRKTDSGRFDDSAVVLLNAKGDMLGTRITGPVSASLRNTTGGVGTGGKWSKILALAPKVSSCVVSMVHANC